MTKTNERVVALDALRGAAILGILTMNITLALPGPARLVPTVSGGFAGMDFAVWVLGFILFDDKMITLLSMLFGVGLFIAGERNADPASAMWRRQLGLLLIGLFHAYLIWDGDILVCYAICGVLVFPLRKQTARRLAWFAALFWLPAIVLSGGFALALRDGSAADVSRITAEFRPSPEAVRRLIAENDAASWWQALPTRIRGAVAIQAGAFPLSLIWSTCARMLLGMALWKSGLLAGSYSPRRYARLAARAYALGLPVVLAAMWGELKTDFSLAWLFGVWFQLNQAGSVFMAIGHACLLLSLIQLASFRWAGEWLAGVGRLALSNYLGQSLAATWIFNGYGLGQFGRWNRTQLAFLVLAFWLGQLLLSRWWLQRFAAGPVERLWRWWISAGRSARLPQEKGGVT